MFVFICWIFFTFERRPPWPKQQFLGSISKIRVGCRCFFNNIGLVASSWSMLVAGQIKFATMQLRPEGRLDVLFVITQLLPLTFFGWFFSIYSSSHNHGRSVQWKMVAWKMTGLSPFGVPPFSAGGARNPS